MKGLFKNANFEEQNQRSLGDNNGIKITECRDKYNLYLPKCTFSALCGNLAAPTNGTMDFPSPPVIGSMANFTCGACYTLMGSSTLTCLDTGLWDAVAPTCDRKIFCHQLGRNGRKPVLGVLRTTKAQTSLRIRAV